MVKKGYVVIDQHYPVTILAFGTTLREAERDFELSHKAPLAEHFNGTRETINGVEVSVNMVPCTVDFNL